MLLVAPAVAFAQPTLTDGAEPSAEVGAQADAAASRDQGGMSGGVATLEVSPSLRGESVFPSDGPQRRAAEVDLTVLGSAAREFLESEEGRFRIAWLGVEGSLWGHVAGGAAAQGSATSAVARGSVEQEAWAHVLWLHAAERLSVHRRTALGSRFRPSYEGLFSAGYELALSPFYPAGQGLTPDGFLGVSYRYDHIVDLRRGGVAMFDYDIEVVALEWVWLREAGPGRLGFFSLSMQQSAQPLQQHCEGDLCVEHGMGVFGVEFDLLDLDGANIGDSGWAWGGHVGVDILGPTGPYTSNTTTSTEGGNADITHDVVFEGASSVWPRLGAYVELRTPPAVCAVRRGADVLTCGGPPIAKVEVVTVHRLAAGGDAVDGGILASIEGNLDWSDMWSARALAQGLWAVRTVNAGELTPDGRHPGDLVRMVNLELETRYRFAPRWESTVSMWLERSDRSEPTRMSTAGDALRWSTGTQLGLVFAY